MCVRRAASVRACNRCYNVLPGAVCGESRKHWCSAKPCDHQHAFEAGFPANRSEATRPVGGQSEHLSPSVALAQRPQKDSGIVEQCRSFNPVVQQM